jgi:hypothetical protein
MRAWPIKPHVGLCSCWAKRVVLQAGPLNPTRMARCSPEPHEDVDDVAWHRSQMVIMRDFGKLVGIEATGQIVFFSFI